MDMQDRQNGGLDEGGFILVEVSLAVLVIGIGLLAIFSLFPSGLRAVEDDKADTRSGLFAQTVLSGMRGNAAGVTNWGDWCYGTTVQGVWYDITANVLTNGVPPRPISTGIVAAVVFPEEGEDYLRYRLTLNTANSNRYWTLLEVEDGRYPENVMMAPSKFYTEFYYLGR